MCSVESLITEEFGHKHLCVVDKTSDVYESIFLFASLIVTTVLCPICVAEDMPGPVDCVSLLSVLSYPSYTAPVPHW